MAVITGDLAPGIRTGQTAPLLEGLATNELPRAMAIDRTELTYLQN